MVYASTTYTSSKQKNEFSLVLIEPSYNTSKKTESSVHRQQVVDFQYTTHFCN